MELYIVNAFTNQMFSGNQAGVVLLNEDEPYPEALLMQKIAAELKYSETAFVKAINKNTFKLRYFTPEGEVALCGHATVSSFSVLRNEKKLAVGTYISDTRAGKLKVIVESDMIWLEIAQGKLLRYFTSNEKAEIYETFGLNLTDQPKTLNPCIVNTGLSDILLPVNRKERLNHAIQKIDKVIKLSKKYQTIGVHMYFYSSSPQVTAYCRNFAPLYGINEESATGTSNGALTYYLFTKGLISEQMENTFIQGESMNKPSVIRSRINSNGKIYIGGDAVIFMNGIIKL